MKSSGGVMEGPSGREAALLLLRILPAETLRRVLACMAPGDAQRVSAILAAQQDHLTPEAESHALRSFFELGRSAQAAAEGPSPPAGSPHYAERPAAPALNIA